MKHPGSGLYLKLKPNETLQLKGTNYIIKNNGQFTTDLHVYTTEYDAYVKNLVRTKEIAEIGPKDDTQVNRRLWNKMERKK